MKRSTVTVTTTQNIDIAVNEGNSVLVQLTGNAFTGNVDFQSTIDGANYANTAYWQPRAASPSRTVAQIANPSTATLYLILPPLTQVRIAVSSVSAGTLTVVWQVVEYNGSGVA